MTAWAVERYYEHDDLTDEERETIANEMADAWEARIDAARKGE